MRLLLVILTLFIVLPKYSAAQSSKTKTVINDSVFIKDKKDIGLYFNDGQFAEVIKRSEPWIKKYPKDTALVVQRTISLLVEGRKAEGVGLLQSLIKKKDSVARYLMTFSIIVNPQDSGKYSNICGDEAIRLSPNSYYGYFTKGVYLFETRNYAAALGFMEKAYMAKNNTPRDKNIMGSFYARCLHETGKKEEAYILIENIIKNDPSHETEILDNYGNMLRNDKKFDKAAEVFKQLSDKNPNEFQFKLAMVGAINNSGKNKEACTILDSMIEKDKAYEFLRYDLRCQSYFYIPKIDDGKSYTMQCFVDDIPFDCIISKKNKKEDGSIEFDWENQKTTMKGHTILSQTGFNSSTEINDKFVASLPNGTVAKGITFWLSKSFFEELKKKKSCELLVSGKVETFKIVEDNMFQPDYNRFENMIPVNSKPHYIECIHLQCAETGHELWVNNSKENAMILKLYLGTWAMELVSID